MFICGCHLPLNDRLIICTVFVYKDIPPPSERFSPKLSSYNFRSVSDDARYFFDLLRDDNGAHWLKIKKKTLSTGRAYSIHIAWRELKAFYDAVSEFLNSSNLAGSFNRRIERKVFLNLFLYIYIYIF